MLLLILYEGLSELVAYNFFNNHKQTLHNTMTVNSQGSENSYFQLS